MNIGKFKELPLQFQEKALNFIKKIETKQKWNTTKLLQRAESLKGNYGGYIIMKDLKPIGFFIISDSDGDNIDSDNYLEYQYDETAYWITSFYIEKYFYSNNNFFDIIKFLTHNKLLAQKPIYVFAENKKLFNIMSERYKVEAINKDPYILRISENNYNVIKMFER